jgi:predicted phage terminase large subunit-like protein
MNLLEPDGRFWGLFTPWHLDDLNARLNRARVYPLVQRAVTPELDEVWPEKWSADELQTRKGEVGTSSFARGYRLVPLDDDETPIRKEWVKFWTEPAECEEIILSVDPAVSTAANADRSALVVLGRMGAPTQIRVLAAVARRVQTPELVNLIDELDRHWNPAVILFESNAAFRGIKDLLTRQARFGPKLKSVTQTSDKAARVAAFSVAVENGAFLLKGDGTQRELFDEMTTFPFGEHDDLLDAAATGCKQLLDRREPRVW